MRAVQQNNHMKTFLMILGLVLVLVIAGWAGYALMRPSATIPTPTPTPDNAIIISAPAIGAHVGSPLIVTGQARGSWFFEAVFPVVLTDASGAIIAQTQAHAKSDWMTTDFVPFTASVSFASQVSGARGFLILKKDNPSGLPANDDSRKIQVFFK